MPSQPDGTPYGCVAEFIVIVMILAACVLFFLTGCARDPLLLPGTQPNGTPTSATYPETADQCAAQPTLSWCRPR